MPFLVRDPWRKQYFEHIECPDPVLIPIDDMDAWGLYPRERHVYDRLYVAGAQGLAAGPHGTEPPFFPIFSKPIINLKGMGIGSRVIATREEYNHSYQAGHFWMPVLEGAHLSTDCVILNGQVRWVRHAQGEPFRNGMFKYWTILDYVDPELLSVISEFSGTHLGQYCGMVNFETIDKNIIEVHLRFADQWCDLYGASWIAALVELYRDHAWNFNGSAREGYSIPLFADASIHYNQPSSELQARIRSMPDISSLQITFDPTKLNEDHARPPGGMRLALVNSWTLSSGLAAIDLLATAFPSDHLIRCDIDLHRG